MPFNVLILGASYGSLLATKLALAGHDVTMACRQEEADLINDEGTLVRIPVRGAKGVQEVAVPSRGLAGRISAKAVGDVSPEGFDLVCLAMQEPQYGAPGVRQLLAAVARAKVPCMSIMNMPPLPYLHRIPNVDASGLRQCFTEADVWESFDPACLTLCSPDPQAFRPPEEGANVLQVTLPTNFKAAAFDSEEHNSILRALQKDIESVRYDAGDGPIELPVKLKVHQSVFVPLAKWAMLIAGNYRCVTPTGPRAIREAVHSDLEATRAVYNWVCDVCVSLGASAADMVPFEKYAAAAQGLAKPSSAARALFAGAPNIERVDLLVQGIAAQQGLHHDVLDETVALVSSRLASNRQKAA